jgi:hypothetical protein
LEDEQQEVQAMYPIYTHRRQGWDTLTIDHFIRDVYIKRSDMKSSNIVGRWVGVKAV